MDFELKYIFFCQDNNNKNKIFKILHSNQHGLHMTQQLPLTSVPTLLQDDDKNFRRAPSWRKKFRPKDVRGGSLGASDTLPANFRVASGGTASPSPQPKRSPMDG